MYFCVSPCALVGVMTECFNKQMGLNFAHKTRGDEPLPSQPPATCTQHSSIAGQPTLAQCQHKKRLLFFFIIIIIFFFFFFFSSPPSSPSPPPSSSFPSPPPFSFFFLLLLLLAQQLPVGQDLRIHEVSITHTHTHTPQSVGLLWTSDRLIAENST